MSSETAREHELGQLREGAGGVWYNFSHIRSLFAIPLSIIHVLECFLRVILKATEAAYR